MIAVTLERLAEIVGGELRPSGGALSPDDPPSSPGAPAQPQVDAVAIDTRILSPGALFVALGGRAVDGHAFLPQAAAAGAGAALVKVGTPEVAGLPTVAVADPLAALQRLAAWYRRAHLGRVVAITGSNGKTVVKDALASVLAPVLPIAASPGSFNSQLGVALSILAAPPGTPLAIFEAGISAPGEMAALAAMLAPDCGILTNVGLAHIAAFADRRALAREKLGLFAGLPPTAATAPVNPAHPSTSPVDPAHPSAAPGAASPSPLAWPAGSPAMNAAPALAPPAAAAFVLPPGGWLLLPGGDPLIAEEAARLACRQVRYPDDAELPRLVERTLADGAAAAAGEEAAGGGRLSEWLEVEFPSGARHRLRVRTRSAEILDDLMLAIGAAHLLGVDDAQIVASLHDYAPPPTRLEVWRSPSGVTLVNDLVSADPISVRAALRTTSELAARGGRKLFVFGGMRELGPHAAAEHAAVGALAGEHGFDALLLVAPPLPGAGGAGIDGGAERGQGAGSGHRPWPEETATGAYGAGTDGGTERGQGAGGGHRPWREENATGTYGAGSDGEAKRGQAAGSTHSAGRRDGGGGLGGELQPMRDAYLAAHPAGEVLTLASVGEVRRELRRRLAPGDTLLLKGPRHSGIDAAALDLMDAMAPNRLVVDLGAVAGNIASFRRACGPGTRIMAMVKAVAYGSDLVRLSSWLSGAGVDQLGVSTADEGAELRRAGLQLPILVTLPTAEEAEKLARFDLTPALYSFALVEPLAAAARALRPADRPLAVHLKLDTGMHRVGVAPRQAVELARRATAAGLHVTGVMTHLASADDPDADADTRRQLALFDEARAALAAAGFADLLAHAAATAAAARFPEARYDMVRLGLGLYGLHPSAAVECVIRLQLAVSLLSRIAEVRTLVRGDRVGYNGTYRVEADTLSAGVLPLGYHDGVPWSLSNRGIVLVGGRPAPILGRISMDSLIVDLSATPDAKPSDEALLFGTHHGAVLRPEDVAARAGTIPYELLARLGPRIQRVYVGF